MEIKVVKSPKKKDFKKVEIREPLMEDVILAERIAGKTEGAEFQLALLAQVGTFDGEKQPPEELRGLSMKDFLSVSTELLGSDIRDLLMGLVGPQSALQGKQEPASGK